MFSFRWHGRAPPCRPVIGKRVPVPGKRVMRCGGNVTYLSNTGEPFQTQGERDDTHRRWIKREQLSRNRDAAVVIPSESANDGDVDGARPSTVASEA